CFIVGNAIAFPLSVTIMPDKKFDYRAVVLVFLAISGLLILLLLNRSHLPHRFSKQLSIRVGRPAPDFTFPDIEGNMISLSDYGNEVVLVNVWATWCPSCVEEMASMEKLYQQFKGENFEILAVSIDALGQKVVAPFMKTHRLTFPVLFDVKGSITTSYGTTGVPESFIVNKQGILVKKIIGPLNWSHPNVLSFFADLIRQQ
ncbi:MAG: TlpA disulfide reductase family protein, partial [Deltaproteobacteria bacterium]